MRAPAELPRPIEATIVRGPGVRTGVRTKVLVPRAYYIARGLTPPQYRDPSMPQAQRQSRPPLNEMGQKVVRGSLIAAALAVATVGYGLYDRSQQPVIAPDGYYSGTCIIDPGTHTRSHPNLHPASVTGTIETRRTLDNPQTMKGFLVVDGKLVSPASGKVTCAPSLPRSSAPAVPQTRK